MKKILAAFMLATMFSSHTIWGEGMKTVELPKPKVKGGVSVEEAINKRRSVRSYSGRELTLDQASQLLWACQGMTGEGRGLRAAPSAGALYPLEIYLVKGDGVFHYLPEGHRMEEISAKDVRAALTAACFGQRYIEEAGLAIVISAVYERVSGKYGQRGVRYTDMEAGHAAQNVFLQAEAMGLASLPIGAFDEEAVAKVIGAPSGHKPVYVLPVGYRK